MTKNLEIFFSKLTLISLSQEKTNISNILIELSHNKNTDIISYPQNIPLILSLNPKPEKEIFYINIKSKQINKKQKLLGHGELIIYKKYLSEKPIEKIILLFKNDKENDKIKISNNNIGKIFVQIKLNENNSNNKNFLKEKINDKKEDKHIESPQKIDEIKNNNNLSNKDIDTKFSKFDKDYNIEEVLSYENINKLKEIIDNKEDLFPKDINLLKSFNQNLFNQYKTLNEHFSKILLSISENNQNLKEKIIQTEDKNKEIKEEINKLQLDINKKEEDLKQYNNELAEKNENFLKNIETLQNQENSISQEIYNDKNKIIGDNNDIRDICNLIKKLDSLGYGLQMGDITDSEKQNFDDLLKNYETEKNIIYKEDIIDNNNELNELKDDFELGDIIISLIERDVNDLFSRKLIEMVTIDQIDSIKYSFSNEKKKKEISFKIENNNLICSTGETFAVWLIKNFSL